MDKATLLGFLVAGSMIILAIYLGGSLLAFISLTSLMITVGGAIGATTINFTATQAKDALRSGRKAFSEAKINFTELIEQIISFSEKSRREGLLVLEKEMKAISDEFLKKGLQLVIDGTDQDMVKTMLEIEMSWIEERHKTIIKFWDALGMMLPAWGMIGTIIGLIAMLKNLDDPTSVGPAMAIALLTTLYGALGANLFAIPIAGKLKIRHEEEMLIKTVMIEGVISVQSGDNPRMVREKLNVFFSPSLRTQTDKE